MSSSAFGLTSDWSAKARSSRFRARRHSAGWPTFTRRSRTGFEPEADLAASLQAVPRLLYIDAGLRAYQTRANLYGASPETGVTNENSVTTVLARFSPRIEGMAGEHLRYLVRSDNNWTNEGASTAPVTGTDSSGYFGQHVASIERDPLPFGWKLEVQRSETTYRDTSEQPLVISLARATTLYALGPDLNFGVHGGYERTSFDTQGREPLDLWHRRQMAAHAADACLRLRGGTIFRRSVAPGVRSPDPHVRLEHRFEPHFADRTAVSVRASGDQQRRSSARCHLHDTLSGSGRARPSGTELHRQPGPADVDLASRLRCSNSN